MKKEYPDRIEYLNDKGQFHREDGPATEWSHGTKEWFINDKHHREDGPAVEYSDGDKSYYLNGIKYSEDQFNQEVIKLKLKRLINGK